MAIVFKNNAKTTLAGNVTTSATSITVSDGSVFPAISGGDTFFCTFDDGTNNEIVSVTAISGNVLTVVRAQDNTTAKAFTLGDAAESRLTAGILNLFSQTGVAITDEIEAYLDANGTTFPDNVKAQFGDGSDLEIFHNGTKTVIDNNTGNIEIRNKTDDGDVLIQSDNGSGGLATYFLADGSTTQSRIFFGGDEKLKTTSTGIDVTGVITTDGLTTSADINFGDNDKAVFGAGSDLQIYHSGTNSIISEQGTGVLEVRTNGTEIQLTGNSGTDYMARFVSNGKTQLHYDGSAKLDTTSTGIDVTGTATMDGLTVDVSSNGTTTTAASFKNNGSGANTKARLDFFAAATRYAGISGGYGSSAPELSFDISGTDVLDINSTGIDVTGTVTATGGNSTNWNTAYGWGNHASAGYLTSSSTQSKYLRSDTADTATGKITFNAGIDNTGALHNTGVIYLGSTATANDLFAVNNGTDIFIGTSSKGLRTYKDLHTNSGNNKYWHAGNDGAGSGLDADLLDGQHGSYYLAYGNLTGTPTIPSLSGYATESYVGTQISNLVDSSPAALNTLNELAAALGDDANFSTTVNANIATKMPKAGGTFTGATTYNVGGDAITISSGAPQMRFNDTTSGADDFWIHVNSNIFYVLGDRDDSGSWESPHPLELHSGTNIGYTFGHRLFTEAYHPNADTLTTARTIGGVSFNGSANINLPGVNTSGNQNTSGTSAGLSGTPNISVGTINSGAIDSSGTSNFDSIQLTDASRLGFGTVKAGATIAHTASVDEGIFWHTTNDYGIYRTSGAWSSPFPVLKIAFATGVEIDGGTAGEYGDINFSNSNLKMGGTQFLDTSRNLSSIGTISSGNITLANNSKINLWTTAGASGTGTIHMPRAGAITFYGDESTAHSITSRDSAGTVADDLRINSYGAVNINLDSNNNNSSAADFLIGRHGGQTGTISDLFRINGETGAITTSGNITVDTDGADAIIDVKGNSSYDPVLRLRSDQGSIATEGFEIWYDNTVGDVHLNTTYPNDAASIHFQTRTGAGKSTANKRLTINGNGNVDIVTGSLRMGTTPVIDSARNVYAANGFVASNTWVNNNQPSANNAVFSGYGAIGNRTTFYITNGGGSVEIGNGTVHNNNPTATFTTSALTLGANRVLQMNGQTVIDASRNITAGAGYVTATRLRVGDGTDGFFYSDTAGRTAFASGDFYIQTSVNNFYNYATNTYMGAGSGDTIHFRGNVVTADNWGIPASGTITSTGIRTSTNQARVKLGVWSDNTYGIGMQSGYTYGGLNNDYAMSFQMNGDNDRGFWWGDNDHTNAQGAMSLTTQGRLTVAEGIRVGGGETDTTIPSAGLTVAGGNLAVFGPNAGWSKTLAIGGNANNSTANQASIGVTNGNLHIDAADGGFGTLINFYDGTGGTYFGNGASATVARIDGAGRLNLGSSSAGVSGYSISVNGVGVLSTARNIDSIGTVTLSGNLRRTAHNVGHLEGSYNNVGSNSDKTNPIYTIGSAYNPSATSVGGMYGIGYAHPNLGSWGSNKSSGWGLYVAEAGTIHATISVGGMWSNGAIQSNTSFIVGSTATVLSQDTTKLKIQTSTGYVSIGSGNSSYTHIITDRGRYYFNASLVVDGGIVSSYDEDLILRRNQGTGHQLTIGASGVDINGNLKFATTQMLNSGGWYRQAINPATDDAVSGTWTESSTSASWGNLKVGTAGLAYTDTIGGYKQYNIPSGAQTAYMSQLKWSNCGYVDVHGVQADGDLVFLCRVSTFQDIENDNEGDPGEHDGQEIRCIGTRLQTFTAIRITNKSGRFHFTGIAFTNQDVENVDNGIYRAEQIRGGSLTGISTITTSGNITAYSDERLKTNIQTLDSKKALQMRGVSFIKDGIEGSGVIAQEIEEIAPELVMTADDEMGTKSVAYGSLVGYLIEAIKDQQKEIEYMKSEIKHLQENNNGDN